MNTHDNEKIASSKRNQTKMPSIRKNKSCHNDYVNDHKYTSNAGRTCTKR